MYNKIINPVTGKSHNIKSKIGVKILKRYLNGGSGTKICICPTIDPSCWYDCYFS